MAVEMVSFNVKIPKDWREALKTLAEPAQRTVAGEVRLAIFEHLGRPGETVETKGR